MNRQDAGRVVALLAAAFPAYPMNDDSTTLYVEALTTKVYDVGLAMVVVSDWVSGRTTFPTMAELLTECAAEMGRRNKRATSIARGKGCLACGGDGYEEVEDPERPSYLVVIPCHVCHPAEHQDWSEGHNAPGHDVDDCDWPLCQKRKTSKTRARGHVEPLVKAAAGTEVAPPPRYEPGGDF